MTRLTLTLLGPFQAEVAGQTLHFPTDKTAALLAYLAVEEGRPHRREVLATLFWPDQPDDQARRNLRLTLHRLKQTLDEAAPAATPFSEQLFSASRSTVQWHTAAAQVDYQQFVVLLTQVEKHAHPQLAACEDCVTRMETAASLLRGEMLTGLFPDDAAPFAEWLLVQREFVHHRALRLYATLAGVYETRGDYTKAFACAQQQLLLEPWYEAAHRQAMRALALSGDRDRALAQFETCRTVLWDELGVEPAAETAVLQQQIRDNTLVSQPTSTPLHHIPADLTPFIGRNEELERITKELLDPACRLLTLIGPGGIGKTRLAIQSAHRLAASAPTNCTAIYFVPLATATTQQTAVTILAEKLGVTLSGDGDPLQAIWQHLRVHNWLLLLDNLEQLPDAPMLVATLLREAPQVQVLVTSREPLHLHAERRLPLAGLPYPATTAVDNVMVSPAVALFVQSARQMVPDFRLDATAVTAVIKLCQLVDGLPLALELAAGWVRVMDCAAILRETEQNLAFLVASGQHAPVSAEAERHRSLQAIFNQTWMLLSPHLQHLLAQAALFPGAFTLTALQGILRTPTMMDVATLLDKSLLRRTNESHYELHPLLQQFAAAQVEPDPDFAPSFSRYYLRTVAQRQAALYGPAPQQAVHQIHTDLVHVRQAWQWGTQHQLWADLYAALPALSRFYQMAGLFAEAVTGIEQTLAVLDGENGTETAVFHCQLLLQYSHFLGQQGQYEAAIAQAKRVLALAEALPDTELEAEGHARIGEWLRHQGRYLQAEEALTTAITLFAGRLSSYLAAAHNEMGFVHMGRGQYRAAQDAFQLALTLYQEMDDWSGTAVTFGNLGYAAQFQSRHADARGFLQQALAMAQEIGDRQGVVKHTLGLGALALQEGDIAGAQVQQQAALKLATEIGYLRGILTAHRHMADASLYQNKLDEAEQSYRRLLMQAQRARLGDLAAHATGNLGIVYARRGEYENAIRQYEAAIALCHDLGDPISERKHLSNLGSTYRRLGRYDAAQQCFTAALRVERMAGLRQGEANSLMNLGALTHRMGGFQEAQAYFERALAIFTALAHKDGIGKCLGFLGTLHQDQGAFTAAIARFEEALAVSEALNDRLTAAVWKLNLVDAHLALRETDTAAAYVQEALTTFRELNSKQYMTAALLLQARMLQQQGQPAAARLAVEEAVMLAAATGEKNVLFEGQVLQAQILAALGKGETAVSQLQQLLQEESDSAHKAVLHYELWCLNAAPDHARAAHALYQELTAQTPSYQYQQRLATLTAALS
ncbi:MAG: tetratricopeptide repeat protein [Chloroflexota bacterium]